MYGAILGDMIGSPYEFQGEYVKDHFPLFTKESTFTDDTVMTVAVADSLMGWKGEELESVLTRSMQKWGRKYPDAGYGGHFISWIFRKNPVPYNSFGNGSAMRVSPVGWLYPSLEATIGVADLTAMVTHDHPQGIKGAEAIAGSIYIARTGGSKQDIHDFVTGKLGYRLYDNCKDVISKNYSLMDRGVSCQETVPQALTAVMEGNTFGDTIRLAVGIGGDTDTIAAMAGSVAEALYGVPDDLIRECRKRLPLEMGHVIDKFYKKLKTNEMKERIKNV